MFPLQRGDPLNNLGPPVLVLHGITSIVSWLRNLRSGFKDTRTIILPLHPLLMYTTRTNYERGELMTTLQYARVIVDFLDQVAIVSEVDLVAWSFGGFTRNYLNFEWVNGKIRRECLCEPMGLPYSAALGASYGLLSWSEAYARAKEVAPGGRHWYQAMLVSFLRYQTHVRPAYTDPYWSAQAFGKPNSWNHSGMLVLLSEDDALVPATLTVNYCKQRMPHASMRTARGEHGCYPQRSEFVPTVCQWLDQGTVAIKPRTNSPRPRFGMFKFW